MIILPCGSAQKPYAARQACVRQSDITARRSHARTPVVASFWRIASRKVGIYLKLLSHRHDPQIREYTHAFLAIAANQLGDGLVAGAFCVLLDVLGVITHSLSIVCMVTMSAFEVALGIAGQAYGAIMRDTAREQAEEIGTCHQGKAEARCALAKSGVADAACAVGLLAGAVGVAFLGLTPVMLFALLTLVKGAQSLNTSYEVGHWYCLRSFLHIDKRAQDAGIFSTAGFIEMATGSTLLEVGKWGTYMTALALSWVSPPLFLTFSIGALMVGGLLTAVPKMWFAVAPRPAFDPPV